MQIQSKTPGDCRLTMVVNRNGVRTCTGTGTWAVLCRTPVWANEQTEHSWLGSLEFCE